MHPEFDIRTKPFEHALCGEITYEATFMNLNDALTFESTPMSYTANTRKFSYYSEDFD